MRDILFDIQPLKYPGGVPVRTTSQFTSVVPFILEIAKSYDDICLNADLVYGDDNLDVSMFWVIPTQ